MSRRAGCGSFAGWEGRGALLLDEVGGEGWLGGGGGQIGGEGACLLRLVWAETQLDDGAGVRDQLRLPAVVALKLLHRGFGLGVPVAGGFAAEIAGVDQRVLDLGGAGVIDGMLRRCLRGRFGTLIEQLVRGRTATGVG